MISSCGRFFFAAQPAQGFVDGHAVEIGSRRGGDFDGLPFFPKPDENLLGQVFGDAPLPNQTVYRSTDLTIVRLKEFFEHGFVVGS